MDELVKLYGPIGLGLIIVFLPMLLQTIKQITKWADTTMKITSLCSAYFFVDLFMIATIVDTAVVTVGSILFYVLGGLIYPYFVWLAMQGVYVGYIKPSNSAQVSGK
jgi:hypothetical protein